MFHKNQRPQIDYPCNWQFSIIGPNADELRQAVKDILPIRKHILATSNRSSGGKYTSMSLQTIVKSEQDRNSIFGALQKHPAVKMVL